MMIEYSEISIPKSKILEMNRVILSIGLVIPFHPCMKDKRTIKKALNYAIELVQIKLEKSSVLLAENILIAQLEKIFSALDYNSHCKSIAVIITPDEEKIIYLNYCADPAIFFNTHFSLLDLAGNMSANPEFQLLILGKSVDSVFHYVNGELYKVYSQKNKGHFKSSPGISEINSIVNILKAVNSTNDIPVFITGEDHLIDEFYKSVPFPEIIFRISLFADQDIHCKTQLVVTKINNQWQYWRWELIKGRIELAKRCHNIINGKENVLNALHHWADGILFIDKHLKEQLDEPILNDKLSKFSKDLSGQVEKFLVRGNRIEITEAGLLAAQRGIALIKNAPKDSFKSFNPTNKKSFSGSLF